MINSKNIPDHYKNDSTLKSANDVSFKKVSIILPTFNGNKYLAASIISCLNQTHRNLELIIIDDCSDDPGTLKVINSFNDDRIRYYKNDKNMGVSYSLNFGFEKACGEYFTWTSDDNYFEKTAIEKMLSCLFEKSEKFVYASYFSFSGEDGADKSVVRLPDTGNLERICIACFLFSKEVFESTGGFDTGINFAQDTDYWLRVSKKFKLAFLDEPLYYYRIHPSSVSMSNYKNFSYRAEAILVQYKNSILDSEKAIDNLVNARANYLKENCGESFLAELILKNHSLYRSFIKEDIEKLLLNMQLKEVDFASVKTQIAESFDSIEGKIADSEEFKKMSLPAILAIKNADALRKTIIMLLKSLLDKDLYELFAEFRRLLYGLIGNDFLLLSNITVLELSYNLKKAKIDEGSTLKFEDHSNGVFIEPDIEKEIYLSLAEARKNKSPDYYYYMLKALVNNLIISKSADEVTAFMDFFDDFNTRKFLYERALSLACDNNTVALIQRKIQGLYGGQFN
jgi:glycosyltransferase involved in cell wall biosynthesis